MKEFAESKIKSGFDYVVMGHLHKPQVAEIKNNGHTGSYITLGDWIKKCFIRRYSAGKFELKKYNAK